jgi:hypothetical protein
MKIVIAVNNITWSETFDLISTSSKWKIIMAFKSSFSFFNHRGQIFFLWIQKQDEREDAKLKERVEKDKVE